MPLIMKSFKFKFVVLLGSLFSAAFMVGHLTAGEPWIERDQTFTWQVVPDALGNPEPGNPNIPLEPWHITTYSIVRRGDLVTFEAVSPDAEYVQFLGNCETTHITPQLRGEFLGSTRIRYQVAQLDWQLATDWRLALLRFAC